VKNHTKKYFERLYGEGQGARRPAIGGKALATDLGYPRQVVEAVPGALWEDFLPCGDVFPYVRPRDGDRVLNLGSGAGVDSLALRLAGGFRGGIVNADIVFSVLEKASRTVRQAFPGLRFDWICADGEELPFAPGAFRWVIVNGVLSLCPDKEKLASGLGRVLEEGGILAGADLCRKGPLPDYFREEPDAWAWCMTGALSRAELESLFHTAGFRGLEWISEPMDEFFDRVVFVYRKR
jgi:arsenite methyltransferase